MKPRTIAALSVAPLILLAGCAVNPASSTTPAASAPASGNQSASVVKFALPAAGGQVDKDSFIDTIRSAAESVVTYQALMSTETDSQAGKQSSSTLFQYDYSDSSQPKIYSKASDGTESIYIGQDTWMRTGSGEWTHTANSASSVISTNSGMVDYINQIAAQVSAVTYVGDEELDGVTTHHFSFTPTTASSSAVGVTNQTDYWVDSSYRPIKIQTLVNGQGVTSNTVMEYTQYGDHFDIAAPNS